MSVDAYEALPLEAKIDNADSYAFAAMSIYLNTIAKPETLSSPEAQQALDSLEFPLRF